MLNSKCATDYQQKYHLFAHLLSKKKSKIIKSALLYRASDHGWQPEDFHSKCDNNGPTVCLFKSKLGDCFGGYTSKNWQSFPKGETIID